MLYRIHKYLLSFLLSVSVAYALGQVKRLPDLVHYNIENGLPSNNVYCIHTDRNGYLWLGTENGVVKYNGYNFRIFTTKDGLPVNDVWRIEEDKYSRMWLFSHTSQMGYIRDNQYVKVKGNLENFSCQKVNTFAMIGNDICFGFRSDTADRYIFIRIDTNDYAHKVYEIKFEDEVRVQLDRIGNPYVFKSMNSSLTLYRLYKLELKGNYTHLVKMYDSIPVAVFDGQIVEILHKHMYAHLFKYKYLNHYDISRNKYNVIPITKYGASADEQIYIGYNKIDSLLIITTGGFYVLDSDFRFQYAEKFKDIIDYPVQFSDRIADWQGNIWYTSNNDGMWSAPKIQNIFRANTGLKEIEGAKYISTLENGLSFWWSSTTKKLYSVNTATDKIISSATFTDRVRTITANDGSSVFVATNGYLHLYNFITGKMESIFNHNDTLRYVFDGKEQTSGETRENIETRRAGFLQGMFFCIKYKDRYYISRSNSGVMRLDRLHNKYTAKTVTLSTRLTEYLIDSVNHRLWFYNTECIVCLNPENDKYTFFDKNFLRQLNISGINKVIVDKYDNLYVHCDNKLVVVNLRLLSIKILPLHVNLGGTAISVYDNKLIVAGDFGIGYAGIKSPLSFERFRFVPNFKSYYYKQFNDMAVNNAGNIIINTGNGIYTLNITELCYNRSLISSEKKMIKLILNCQGEHEIHDMDTFYCDPNTESVQLDAINIFGKGDKLFNYKLSDNEWKTTSSGEIFIGKIKPDNFHVVKCSFSDDLWNTGLYSFYIYKQPYWWQTKTWKFIFWVCGICLFLVLVAAVVIITRYRVAKINEKKQKTTELELRALYAQINPHFIFNSLSTAQYFISKKKFDEAYAHVSKFSRLLRSYLKASQARYVTLSKDIEMLRNYIELQQTRFENKFDYVIDIENKIPADSIQIPSLLLQPLVENAINHGLFHDDKRGVLKILFHQGNTNDELICIIEDNGVGRDRAREIKKSSSTQTESYGTKLTKQLIDIFKEYERMDIYLEYVDKIEPETGTIVRLTIKHLKYVT